MVKAYPVKRPGKSLPVYIFADRSLKFHFQIKTEEGMPY